MSTTKPVIPNSTVTRDVRELDKTTDNIYESIVIISKRANQIANNLKEELDGKLAEFIASKEGIELIDAKNNLAKYVREITALLDKGESFDIFNFESKF